MFVSMILSVLLTGEVWFGLEFGFGLIIAVLLFNDEREQSKSEPYSVLLYI